MALYMFFHVIPDAHIEFLSEHPETFRPYMEGQRPEPRRSLLDRLLGREVVLDLPADWPQGELEGFSPEVNHRQVQYFHYLLNGTHDKVSHAGCIFQTWFAPGFDTVTVRVDGENFALKHAEVSDLKERISAVSEDALLARYTEAVGETDVSEADVSEADREFLADAFAVISSACDGALESGCGLLWTAG